MGKDVTRIAGALPANAGLLNMGLATTISNLTVQNNATFGSVEGINVNSGASSNIKDIASIQQRIYNVRVIVRGAAATTYGIDVEDTDLVIENVEVSVGNAVNNRAIRTNDDGNCTGTCFNLINYNDTAKVEIINSHISGATAGVFTYGTSNTRIINTVITATQSPSFNSASNGTLINSKVEFVFDSSSGTIKCMGTYNLSGSLLNNDCS